jgi:hypothetical protein
MKTVRDACQIQPNALSIKLSDQLNIPDYYNDMTRRELTVELAGYLAKSREALRPDEASAARVLSELMKNQRLG